MRFIFKLLLGIIIFNAFLFIFTAEFGGSGGQDITDTGDGSDATKPGNLGYDITSSSFAVAVITAGGGIFVFGALASIFTRNHAWTGAGAICGVIFSLYIIGMSSVSSLFQSYEFALHIWTIFSFCFGVITMIAVVEIFTGRSVDD